MFTQLIFFISQQSQNFIIYSVLGDVLNLLFNDLCCCKFSNDSVYGEPQFIEM